MKLAILETGRPPAGLAERFGDYPAMFARMLGDGFDIETFDVAGSQLPGSGSHDAYLITGSPAGIYEPHPWIDELCAFIRSARGSRMVGVCFGHQAMAESLGGRLEKSEKGWGVGLQSYKIERVEPWMDSSGEIAVPASHQDQVIVQPPNTRVLASSRFTPFAALAWTDRRAVSVQFHPEFSPEFAKALIGARRDRLPDPDAAIGSLNAPNDRDRVAEWIRQFLKED